MCHNPYLCSFICNISFFLWLWVLRYSRPAGRKGTVFSPVWAPATVPSYPFRWLIPHTHAVTSAQLNTQREPTADLQALSLCPLLFCSVLCSVNAKCFGLSGCSTSTLQIREFAMLCLSSSSWGTAWRPSQAVNGAEGSFSLFPLSQRVLSFKTWRPASYKLFSAIYKLHTHSLVSIFFLF